MYYCKELYELSVLSLYEGELIGKVDKLCFDKNFKKLIEIELIGNDGAKMILPCKNIYNIGKSAITVKNNQAIEFKENEANSIEPIGAKTYSINGEFLGVVKDVTLTEKFLTEKIILENDNILNSINIASCGKNVMIFNTKEEQVNIKNFTPNKQPKLFKGKSVQTATILPNEKEVLGAVEIETCVTNFQNTDFLIGRTCVKNIYNFNNELLMKENCQVTKKALKEIIKFNKLRELMLYLK